MEEAGTLLQAAVKNAEITGERFLLWRIHASLGRLYDAVGRKVKAEEQYAAARELVEELADTLPPGEDRDTFLVRASLMLNSST